MTILGALLRIDGAWAWLGVILDAGLVAAILALYVLDEGIKSAGKDRERLLRWLGEEEGARAHYVRLGCLPVCLTQPVVAAIDRKSVV